MKENILVSVAMPNYGQAEFISEAILGVLSQQVNFEIELIVADDCSPDHTEDIVQDIIRTHPNGHWIKYIKHSKNKGAIPNFIWTFSQAKGKYIAACEGDDYWIDPLKLQKQIDFLENNPDYSIVFHKVREINSSGIHTNTILDSPDKEETYNLQYLANGNFIHTPSVVFRKNFKEFPLWINFSPIGDYPLHMLNAQYGLIKYLPEQMAVYRIGNGIWSSQTRTYQLINTMLAINLLIAHFSDRLEIKNLLLQQYKSLVAELQANNTKNIICYDQEKIAAHFPYKGLVNIFIRKIKNTVKTFQGK